MSRRNDNSDSDAPTRICESPDPIQAYGHVYKTDAQGLDSCRAVDKYVTFEHSALVHNMVFDPSGLIVLISGDYVAEFSASLFAGETGGQISFALYLNETYVLGSAHFAQTDGSTSRGMIFGKVKFHAEAGDVVRLANNLHFGINIFRPKIRTSNAPAIATLSLTLLRSTEEL